MYSSCLRCNRPLKNPQSQERGYGPVCYHKIYKQLSFFSEEETEDKFLTEAQYNRLINLKPITIEGDWQSRRVWIDDRELFPGNSQAIRNHSLDGFNWGYGGSGPAQLALAIMLYIVRNKTEACSLYQNFKWDIIARLPQSDFEITIDIGDWLKKNINKDYCKEKLAI